MAELKTGGGALVAFDGEPGIAAKLNYNVPLPGSHTGRRILEVADLDPEIWKEESSSAGTSWQKHLGLAEVDGVLELRDPALLVDRWADNKIAVDPKVDPELVRETGLGLKIATRDSGLETARDLSVFVRGGLTASTKSPGAPAAAAGTSPSASVAVVGGSSLEEDFNRKHSLIDQGIVELDVPTWGGGSTTTTVDVTADPDPKLFIVQVYGISSFLGDYGVGRTVKTMTLLPGESMKISLRTWRATRESIEEAASIIDSHEQSAIDSFAESVYDETTDKATQSKEENWYVDADVKQSWGTGNASVSGGGGGEYHSGTEEFAKSVEETVVEHTAEASSARETTVTSSSESSEETEEEEVIEREIRNINVSRVLNFVFRQLNQQYLTKIHLKDVRIGFSNGQLDSWREVPLSGLRGLLQELVKEEHVDEVARQILTLVGTVWDHSDTPVGVLETYRMREACGASWEGPLPPTCPPDETDYQAPTDALFYRFKRGPLAQDGDDNQVAGVVLKQETVTLTTDSIIVEALLGEAPALDDYSADLQVETIREKALANEREVLAQVIVRDGDAAAAKRFEQVFGAAAAAPEEPSA